MIKVLIADDSKFILDRLQQMLGLLDEVVLVGSYKNGLEALAAISQLKPDLAILDNKMPGIKGIDVIREVRKNDKLIKLMLLTLYSDGYYKDKAIKAGANFFFSKSEDFERVSDVVSSLLSVGELHS